MVRLGEYTGRDVYLRPLDRTDAQAVAQWMRDPDIVRYFPPSTYTETKDEKYWAEFCVSTENNFKFAIVERNAETLIGTVGLSGVNDHYRCARTGIIIGAKELWGVGRAWDAKMLCLHFGFHTLKLRWVYCNIYSQNRAALNHVERCGYTELPYATNPALRDEAGHGYKTTYILLKETWNALGRKYLYPNHSHATT